MSDSIRFNLVRGGAIVADGVLFRDGAAVLRWRGEHVSFQTYESFRSMLHIHHVGNGTDLQWIDTPSVEQELMRKKPTMVISTDPEEAFERAQRDAAQDSCENAPFASIGGIDNRASDDLMKVPEYIAPNCHQAYLAGYKAASERIFGSSWMTCPFYWVPVLEFPGKGASIGQDGLVYRDE